MRIALETNVPAYAEGPDGAAMRESALEVIERLPRERIVLPVQTLGELFNVLVRTARRRPARADWSDAFPVTETTAAVMFAAMLTLPER